MIHFKAFVSVALNSWEFFTLTCSNHIIPLQVDGFRFDLMGHIMKSTMVKSSSPRLPVLIRQYHSHLLLLGFSCSCLFHVLLAVTPCDYSFCETQSGITSETIISWRFLLFQLTWNLNVYCMQVKAKCMLQSLSKEKNGVDGSNIYM